MLAITARRTLINPMVVWPAPSETICAIYRAHFGLENILHHQSKENRYNFAAIDHQSHILRTVRDADDRGVPAQRFHHVHSESVRESVQLFGQQGILDSGYFC